MAGQSEHVEEVGGVMGRLDGSRLILKPFGTLRGI